MEEIPTSSLGLHTLHPREGDAAAKDAVADIVAVHGLGGDAFSAWSEGGVLWLRDLLPLTDEYKDTRIMTFGYDSTAFTKKFSKSQRGRTFTFAEALLSDLADKRAQGKAKDRPIIFIGHSLGGIVIKAALRHARERQSMYGDIMKSTKSIVFFGTPHQGADAATWAGYLSGIGRAIGLKNTQVTEELKRWSDPLVELTKSFSEYQEDFPITTYYESIATHGVIVVSEASATMGWKRETYRQLPATHTSICKFGEGDNTWKRVVLPRLQAIAEDAYGIALGIPDPPEDLEARWDRIKQA